MAASSRYSLQSIVLQLALFISLWRTWHWGSVARIPPLVARAALLVGLLFLSILSNLSAQSRMEWETHVAALDRAGFAIVNGVMANEALTTVYPWPDLIKTTVAALAARKLGPFSLRFGSPYWFPRGVLTGTDLEAVDTCVMAVGLKPKGPHWFDLEGWAYNARVPTGDGLVFVLDHSDHDRLVGVGRQSQQRPDVDEVMHVSVVRSGLDIFLNVPELDGTEPRAFTVVVVPQSRDQPSCRATATLAPAS